MEADLSTTAADLVWFIRQARAPRLRSMRQFAEQEVVIPDGPFAGRRFRCSRQPYTALWFDEVDSGCYSRCVAKRHQGYWYDPENVHHYLQPYDLD